MKLSVVIPYFYPSTIHGGPVFTSLYTLKEVSNLGHEVRVSTTNTNYKNRLDVKKNTFLLFKENMYVKYYADTILNRVSLPLFRGIKKDIEHTDIVHIQSIFHSSAPIALYYANKFKKPVLLSPHGVLGQWIMTHGIPLKKQWLKLFVKPYKNRIIWHATAQQEVDEILSQFPNAKINLIPNGVASDEFSRSNALTRKNFLKKFAKIDINQVDKIIVSIARLHKKKGFDILIKSFQAILKEFPNSYLFIAGDDAGEKGNLLKLIEELRLKDRVFFPGFLEGQDKVDFLANADVFVLPSHNENFGVVYAESLAAGTPIVASKNTPWAEVEKYECGKWVSNTPLKTADAIAEILNNDANLMGQNGMEYIKKYDWKTIAKSFEGLFHEMINSNSQN